MAAGEAARPQSGRRSSPMTCSRCTPRARAPTARILRRHAVAGRDGGVVPVRGDVDQLRATAEVKADMERTVPMDRLVVGDVGYGKTEVALRGAFKATQDGKQVAVLVPTTVLAAQHHATFSQRFAAFPIEVRLLSRFVSPRNRRRRWPAWPTGRSMSSSARIDCCRRTCGSRTWVSSSSTRSSGSASRPRSG